jgi:hypothetical protein
LPWTNSAALHRAQEEAHAGLVVAEDRRGDVDRALDLEVALARQVAAAQPAGHHQRRGLVERHRPGDDQIAAHQERQVAAAEVVVERQVAVVDPQLVDLDHVLPVVVLDRREVGVGRRA